MFGVMAGVKVVVKECEEYRLRMEMGVGEGCVKGMSGWEVEVLMKLRGGGSEVVRVWN